MSTQIQIVPTSGLTVGTTAITSGTVGRILFEGTGNVLQQDSTLFWDNTNKRLGVGATPDTSTRLDIRAQGALSTDIVQRWRNSANSANLGKITGDGAITFGTYTNPNTKLSIDNGASIGAYIGGLKGVYAVGNAAGTAYGIDALGRSITNGGTSYGINSIADGGGVTGTNYGIKSQASGGGTTNYAGYFDAVSATANYALYVQRGNMVFGVSATLNKIGFWNATPIVQPTTAVAASVLSSLGGTNITDTDTFDGYTLKQVVKALRNLGILA